MSDAAMYEEGDWEETLNTDQRAGKKTSGKKWALLFKLSAVKTRLHMQRPEKMYLHPKTGQAYPFRVGSQHFIPFGGKRGKGMSIECAEDIDKTCVVHAYSNPTAYGLTIQKHDLTTEDAKPYYAVGMWVEEWYHLVERPGTFDPSKKFKQREQCEGKGCELCAQNWPKVFGNRAWISTSPGQWRHTFHSLNEHIKNRHCACGGTIYVPHFYCKKCRNVLIDVSLSCDTCHSQEVEINGENNMAVCLHCRQTWPAFYTEHPKIMEQMGAKMRCNECGNTDKPVPDRICSQGCDPVKPLSIFDCQITAHTQGEGKDTRIIIDEYLIQPPDPRLFDPQFQGADQMALKIAESMRKPMDLNYLLKPMTPDEQAKLLKVQNPFSITGRVQGVSNYPKLGPVAPAPGAAPGAEYGAVADEDVPY
jgi:hypothetical protein